VYDETHGRRGDVMAQKGTVVGTSFRHAIDAIGMSYGEHPALSRRVEIPIVHDSSPSDITTWRQRGATVPFLDDPQSRGGSGRCVVRFDDPRFVFMHADCGVIANLCFRPIGV